MNWCLNENGLRLSFLHALSRNLLPKSGNSGIRTMDDALSGDVVYHEVHEGEKNKR